MKYYELLLEKILKGNIEALNELMSSAGMGNAEAQYWLAQYYFTTKGEQYPDYIYWINKSADNGFAAAKESAMYTSDNAEKKAQTIDELKEKDYSSGTPIDFDLSAKFSFSERINRTEYLITIVITIFLGYAVAQIDIPSYATLFRFGIDWFFLSQGARRLHDFGASGWWILIPVISWIVIIFPKGDDYQSEEQ